MQRKIASAVALKDIKLKIKALAQYQLKENQSAKKDLLEHERQKMQTIERFCMHLSSHGNMSCEEANEERQTADALLSQAKTYYAKIEDLIPKLIRLNEEAIGKAVELAFLRQVH